MKKYFGKLRERNGEYEYTHSILFETGEDPAAWMDEYAKTFYPGDVGSGIGEGAYVFFWGEIEVCVESFDELTDDEFAVLKKYSI